jgi:hypothetical protein
VWTWDFLRVVADPFVGRPAIVPVPTDRRLDHR